MSGKPQSETAGSKVAVLAKAARMALAGLIGWGLMALPVIAEPKLASEEDFSTFIIDPLRVSPAELTVGKTLPGDPQPPTCPVAFDATKALTLVHAVDLALCHNPQVQGAWAAGKVQAAALGEARAAYLPTLTASTSRLNDQTQSPGSFSPSTRLTSTTFHGNLNWRLFDFGGREANKRSAHALLNAALANHDAAWQKTLASVVSAYFEAQTQQSLWAARQKNEAFTQHTLEIAQRRETSGAGAQSDTLQAAAASAKASLERSRAQGAYHKAHAVLVYAMGLPAATQLSLAEDLIDAEDHIRQDLDVWLEQTQTQHPALIAARAQLASAKDKVVSTRSEGLPTLDLAVNFYQNGRPNQGLMASRSRQTVIGVALNVPLFAGFSSIYKVGGAKALVEQKEAELNDVQQQVLMEVVKTHADATAALENLGTSQKLLTAAQAALVSVQRRFERGVADMMEILNAQSVLSDAQQERIRSLADWRSVRLRLMAAAGVLGRGAMEP